MENNEVTGFQKTSQDITASNSLFSELVPAYLEYVRVEQGRPPVTIERYRARLQRFIDELGDCRVGEITPAKLSLYKRHLMDSGLGPVTIGGSYLASEGFSGI
jgi:hypothetical protein